MQWGRVYRLQGSALGKPESSVQREAGRGRREQPRTRSGEDRTGPPVFHTHSQQACVGHRNEGAGNRGLSALVGRTE